MAVVNTCEISYMLVTKENVGGGSDTSVIVLSSIVVALHVSNVIHCKPLTTVIYRTSSHILSCIVNTLITSHV